MDRSLYIFPGGTGVLDRDLSGLSRLSFGDGSLRVACLVGIWEAALNAV